MYNLKNSLLFRLMTSQKGAMFGLDARVALAIFAILSSTAGYIGFSKVRKARDASALHAIESISKALQEYQKDMGNFALFTVDTPSDSNNIEILWDITKVAPNYQKYWNGPYLQDDSTDHNVYGTFAVRYRQSDYTTACTTNNADDCYSWIILDGIPARTWATINNYVDASYGTALETAGNEHNEGRIRADGTTDPRTIYYRAISRLNR